MRNARYEMRDSGFEMREARSGLIPHHASRITHLVAGLALFLGVAVTAAAGNAAEMTAPAEVAPKAEGTRYQTWASAAWCEGTKAWLVAWREGYLNEAETGSDIWCARVAADGKSLDPAGIRLTRGKGLKDRPRVASDGKGWLVVWEDMRGGKDWDVYAGRVSADGKALDLEGILVAGGEDNQCRPDAAYSGGNYYVVWQAQGVSPKQSWKGYSVQGGRVSPEGRVLDKPVDLGVTAAQCNLPVIAARDGRLLAAFNETRQYVKSYVARREVDSSSGQPRGALPDAGPYKLPAHATKGETLRTPALALGAGGGLVVFNQPDTLRFGSVLILDQDGGAGAVLQFGYKRGRGRDETPRYSVAAAGDKQFLVVGDYSEKGRFLVGGWRFAPDGKPIDDEMAGFVVAADPAKDAILPAAASGPAGACLVVYSEVRGADDVKVLARVVK